MDPVAMFISLYGKLPTEYASDYLELLRMSKYTILDAPKFKPSKCSNCGSSKQDGRGYIDFGLEIDWYGIVYICTLCFKDVAVSIGLFEPYEEALEKAQETPTKTEELLELGNELKESFVGIQRDMEYYFASLRTPGDDSTPNRDSSVELSTDKPAEPGTDKPKPRTTKSDSSGGSKKLPSLAELLGN